MATQFVILCITRLAHCLLRNVKGNFDILLGTHKSKVAMGKSCGNSVQQVLISRGFEKAQGYKGV